MLRFSFVIAVVCLTSCASSSSEPQPSMTKCEDPRPQICTMIYDPVCGVAADGTRKIYASDCSACSHADVIGYEKGECEK